MSSARGLSNPLFKVGSVNLLNQNQNSQMNQPAIPQKLVQAYQDFLSNIGPNTGGPQTGNLNPNGIEPLPIDFDQRSNDPFLRKGNFSAFELRETVSQVFK